MQRVALVLLLAACDARSPCEDDQVRVDGTCTEYTAGAPVQADVVAPEAAAPWQWQLTGVIDTSIDVPTYDIDLYDTSDATHAQLHADGRVFICYFSAGSYEPWRPDADRFPLALRSS